MPSRSIGLSLGLLARQRTSEPGPGSISTFVSSSVSHMPPDFLSCLVTTKRAPAVPKNFNLFMTLPQNYRVGDLLS